MRQFVEQVLCICVISCLVYASVPVEGARLKRLAINPSEALTNDKHVPANNNPDSMKAHLGSDNQAVPPGGNVVDKKKGAPEGNVRRKIAESVECAEDVKRFCSDRLNSNNFLILDCLQDDEKTASQLSTQCHHYLWEYKLRLTKDGRFDQASIEACGAELAQIPDCKLLEDGKGHKIPCLIEHYEEIQTKQCSSFLNKMAGIIFSDYRFMDFFMKDCKKDIRETQCGRLETLEEEGDVSPHSQGRTVTCLAEHKKQLTKSCKKALMKVAELQSDDYHLDRPLYYACKDDRDNLCSTVSAGEGAVFKCLYQHLGDEKLSTNCRARLEERQTLIADDIKVDKSFYKACKKDIKENNCIKGKVNTDGELEEDLHRSTILLCLEMAQSKGKKVEPQCLQEMFELRSELMQDYKISPELVSACQREIQQHCSGLGPGGETIDCLMKASIPSPREQKQKAENGFSAECRNEIAQLLHVANPGEDIILDRPLQRACGEVVTKACHDIKSGHGDLITCLLDNLDDEDMTDECEDHLLVIQYFAVRDFKLDAHLFKQCRTDAINLCHAADYELSDVPTAEQGPMVFACLHRFLRSDDPGDQKPSRPCAHELRRAMRERSMRINLMPEVEEACIEDLSDKCSDDEEHTEEGAEMECLQLNLEDLRDKCRAVMTNFTVEQSEDLEMDRILMKACTPMIKKFCAHYLETDAMPSDVLDCLIDHKTHHDMNEKCAAGIEHHQIISLKDFRFNQKFREACQSAVARFCQHKKTKYDVVACLSEHVRNDTLIEAPQRIERRCQKQLKFELLQRGESIKLDPVLEKACLRDIPKFCNKDIKNHGEGKIEECLRAHMKRLSDDCHKVMFMREREEAVMGDYSIMHVCKKMIKEYCEEEDNEADILDCLAENKDKLEFDDSCRQVVQRRQVERTHDIRLNPHLERACKLDIPKFCSDVFRETSPVELEGKVIDCLKKKFAAKKRLLSRDCEHEIQSRVKEAALDINLDPVVMKTCKADIKQFCIEEISNVKVMKIDKEEDYDEGYVTNGHGAVVECLKRNFQKLKDYKCKKEVAYMIAESRIDVQVDPVLHTACQQDILTLCKDISQGQGRQMSCLLSYLESDESLLKRSCREMLKRRKDLWEYAAQVAPAETLSEIVDQVVASPARNYFIAIFFTFVGVVLLMGIFCGRVTKRVRAELKNK